MLGVVGTTRWFFVAFSLLSGPAFAAPSSHPAERRIIVTPDADYSGFDTKTLKGIDLDACKAACLGDNNCRAFTFNNKAGWCFVKSEFGALSASPGATAGRVVDVPELTPNVEKKRTAELNFFPSSYIDEARTLAGALKDKFSPGTESYKSLRDAGGTAFKAANFDEAAKDFGAALSVAPENPAAWLDFAAANLARKLDSWSDRQAAATDATAAAINAYLRADDVDSRATALATMGTGFERREQWQPAYRSYRASLVLREDKETRDSYERVTAEHGFRIVSHEVDADSATPRICVVFSDPLPVSRPGLADFVTVDNGDGLSIEPDKSQICVDGVKHGSRYHIRVRGGLPSADGEVIPHPAEIDVYVRDRDPWVGFPGNAYVLPAGKGASMPIVSVNASKVKATIYRIGDRGLAGAVRDGTFLHQLDGETASTIADSTGEKIWEGTIDVASKLNENITTAIPVADALSNLQPGAYVVRARAENDKSDETGTAATQWFVVTDLGLTALSGHDGVHAIIRSLSTAKPVAGVKVHLVATNENILGEAVSDADGFANFEPGLARGTGGAAPQLIDAVTAEGDYAFLDLSRSAFDLSDRGVDGRTAPKPLDVFLTPERGIYRPGETIHLTGLVRDARANAVGDLPMTLIATRPDGVEYQRKTLSDGGAGGYSADIDLETDAMRGSWLLQLFADPKGEALAESTVLVEDFEPERLAFELTSDAKLIAPDAPATVGLAAKYLYGAPAPNLAVEGDIEVKTVDTLAAFAGYKFGLVDETVDPIRQPLTIDASTDDNGKASFQVALPDLPTSTKLFTATAIIRLADTNGRAVERKLDLPVKSPTPRIGVRPLFDGDVAQGGPAKFEIIAIAPDGTRAAAKGLTWKLDRIESEYQWYKSNGAWDYELVSNSRRIDGGTIDTSVDAPATVSPPVDWGQYKLTVESDGDQPAATSFQFYAGWYTSNATSETPDTLKVALDKPAYKIGETAKLRLDPRFPGTALITVIDDRLITMKAVEVPADGTTVDLPVTDQWGPGAYVAATLYRPMDIDAKRMPARALGLAWAKVDPGDRDLTVSIATPDELRPRQPMTIPVAIGNLKAGDQAYVTVAAVDVGILNLTNFKPPAPDDWYFGQRKLGIEIRDVYGLLIDRMQGAPGTVRSGGDSGAVRLQAPPPTEKLVAFYSGIVRVGDDGKASVSFDVPDFNGTVRVMAMAWTKAGVGHAAKDVIVRDPVVVTASIPRFLAVGDKSRLLVEVNNVAGAAGDYKLAIDVGDGVGVGAADKTKTLTLAEKQRVALNMPISGNAIGDFSVTVSLTTPSGDSFPKELTLGVRPAGEPLTRRNAVALNAGGKITVDAEALSEFVPGTSSVAVSVGGANRLDVAGLLAALDRYPYGCVEQLTSRALPLVYLDDVAVTIGIAADKAVHERVQKAIEGVLSDQAASGSFGLWGPYDTGDLWLDSYVTDFLTRAAEKGYDVPKLSRDLALDNLANRIAYAEDFDHGGEDIAYALYVLARAGRAAIGDLRYYAESKINSFATPLAKAQIGAALALYGDRQRAGNAFAAALADIEGKKDKDDYLYRADYGTLLRDEAGILTLAAESKAETVDLRTLATRIATTEATRTYTSTQENAWMLLAAAALIKDAEHTSFSVNGASIAGPLFKRFKGEALAANPVTIVNEGTEALDAIVATTGVPATPEPAGGKGFKIEREYFTPKGDQADVKTVGQNTRFVVVLTVTADHDSGGHILIVDPIPAGFEIENPDISTSGDTSTYDWLTVETNAKHTEARTDRFVAALDRQEGDSLEYSVAYTVRAVSPGTFVQPGATVEDMYRPELSARSASGTVEVVGVTK